jgi:hypothetical protein
MFNISAGTLQNMRINGTLPYSKVGTTILYDYDSSSYHARIALIKWR